MACLPQERKRRPRPSFPFVLHWDVLHRDVLHRDVPHRYGCCSLPVFPSPCFPVSSKCLRRPAGRRAGSGTRAALPGIAIAIRTAGRLGILLRWVLVILLWDMQSTLRQARLWRMPHRRVSQGYQLFVLGKATTVEPSLVVAHGAGIPGGAQRRMAAMKVGEAAAPPARHGESGGEKRRVVLGEPLPRTMGLLSGKLSICCVEIVVHVHSYPLAMASPSQGCLRCR